MTEQRSIPGFDAEQMQTWLALMADLRYPVGPDGDTLALLNGLPYLEDNPGILDTMKGRIAYALTRCGWRMCRQYRLIKARKIYGTGVFEDAVTWVDINEPDDPLADWQRMSLAEAEALPDDLRTEWMRRMGMHIEPPKPQSGWEVKPKTTIVDVPDDEDET